MNSNVTGVQSLVQEINVHDAWLFHALLQKMCLSESKHYAKIRCNLSVSSKMDELCSSTWRSYFLRNCNNTNWFLARSGPRASTRMTPEFTR